MIEIEAPNSVAGILLAGVVVFVTISALITSGLLPVLVAVVVAAAAAYVVYIVLVRTHRAFLQAGRSEGGGPE